MAVPPRSLPLADQPIPLERDGFLRNLLGHLAASLEEVIGLEEASGFIALVGQRVGDELNAAYRTALQAPAIPPERLGEVLVDLKRRIRGEFSIESERDDRLVLVNSACPFGEKVHGRPSLCMMTSNVFGVIAAENTGYARVELLETIANGDGRCRVVVHLGDRAEPGEGREYFRTDEQ